MTKENVLEIAKSLPLFDEDFVWPATHESDSVVEDDGFLHINLSGLHIAFEVGEDASRSKVEAEANKIADAFGLTKINV